jgi:hypothetical protein
MAFEFEAASGEDLAKGGGNWLSTLEGKGTHHVACLDATDTPLDKNNIPIPNAVARFTLQVLASTNPAATAGKQWDLMLFAPKLSAKDGGAMDRRKITRTLLAFGLMREDQVGQKVSVDLAHAKGRQCIVTLDINKQEGKDDRLQLHYDDLWHVDHPDAKNFPKDAKALGLMPKELRRDPASFKKFEAGSGGNGGGATPAGNGNGASSGTTKQAENFDLSNL